MIKRITVPDIVRMKGVTPVSVVTAYDFTQARLADECGIDIILVGDSLGMVFQGNPDTLSVNMEHMIYHTSIVSKAAQSALIVSDIPFSSSKVSKEKICESAVTLMERGKCAAVKIEGAGGIVSEAISQLTSLGIPVMGHVGLTPQSFHAFGGFRKQGTTAQGADFIVSQARELEKAGVFSIVIESVPNDLGDIITKSVAVPTIGIGAGPHCDGQVLVINDLLGMDERFTPSFVRKYADLSSIIRKALTEYNSDVKNHQFP